MAAEWPALSAKPGARRARQVARTRSPPDALFCMAFEGVGMASVRKNLLQGVVILLALAGYLLALNYKRDEVPPGLNNDVAEESLRGIQLVEAGRLEVINTHDLGRAGIPFGHSMETLYLYLVGFAARLLGSTTFAVHLITWFFVLASIVLLCLVVRRLRPAIPVVVPLLLAISSVWLFHYGRSGLRAVTAPMFLLAFVLALDRLERAVLDGKEGIAASRPGRALWCGALLGTSLYGYTSARILPVAFVLYALLRLLPRGPVRRARLRAYLLVTAAALAVSIPNLFELARTGTAYLGRGTYVLPAHLADAARNFFASVSLPLDYPQYARAVAADHHFDGVSFGLTVAGLRPVHPLIGLAILSGVVCAWPRRREPLVLLLLCLWGTSLLGLGIAGPSLTRFLIVLPVFLIFAAFGIEPLLARPWMRGATVAGLLLLCVTEGRSYFDRMSRDSQSAREFAEAATDIGQRARAIAEGHRQVLCIVAGNANVVNFLTHDDRARVWINEFWHRRPDPRELPLQRVEPQVILLERQPGLEPLADLFASFARRESHPLFEEFVVDPAWDWGTLAFKEGPDSPLLPPTSGEGSEAARRATRIVI
jgi:hypothetical protein